MISPDIATKSSVFSAYGAPLVVGTLKYVLDPCWVEKNDLNSLPRQLFVAHHCEV